MTEILNPSVKALFQKGIKHLKKDAVDTAKKYFIDALEEAEENGNEGENLISAISQAFKDIGNSVEAQAANIAHMKEVFLKETPQTLSVIIDAHFDLAKNYLIINNDAKKAGESFSTILSMTKGDVDQYNGAFKAIIEEAKGFNEQGLNDAIVSMGNALNNWANSTETKIANIALMQDILPQDNIYTVSNIILAHLLLGRHYYIVENQPENALDSLSIALNLAKEKIPQYSYLNDISNSVVEASMKLFEVAQGYMGKDKHDEALVVFNKTIDILHEVTPVLGIHLANAGICHNKLDHYEQALKMLNQSLVMLKSSPEGVLVVMAYIVESHIAIAKTNGDMNYGMFAVDEMRKSFPADNENTEAFINKFKTDIAQSNEQLFTVRVDSNSNNIVDVATSETVENDLAVNATMIVSEDAVDMLGLNSTTLDSSN